MPPSATKETKRDRVAREDVAQLAAVIRDPVKFARLILRHDPWSMAEDILTAIATHPRVAIKACHSSGKTRTAAEAVLWWVIRYADGKVITTAPTFSQVERLLWTEMRSAALASRIQLPPLQKTELQLSPGNFAVGLSTNEGVRFQGYHGRLLVLLDEAPGVLTEIYDAIEGMRAGGDVHVVLMGNPVIASGPFHDAFTKDAASWKRFTIGAFDTPNLAGLTIDDVLAMDDDALNDNVRPYLTTRRWVREKYAEWGPGHHKYEARVLARFPAQSESALISLTWLEQSERVITGASLLPVVAGVDVAGPGDAETVVYVRSGPNVVLMHATNASDPRGDVVRWLLPFRSLPNFSVNVDAIGIGYNFGLHLRDNGFTVNLVNVGLPSRASEKFTNLKAEKYWGLRERFESGDIGGVTDAKTQAQLTTIEYKSTPRGQTAILSKDEMRARGIASPDRAEALMLAYADVQPLVQVIDISKYAKIPARM